METFIFVQTRVFCNEMQIQHIEKIHTRVFRSKMPRSARGKQYIARLRRLRKQLGKKFRSKSCLRTKTSARKFNFATHCSFLRAVFSGETLTTDLVLLLWEFCGWYFAIGCFAIGCAVRLMKCMRMKSEF